MIDGTLDGYRHTGMAGVSNVGTDRNWCGAVFACANWYAFGRLAWDPGLGSRAIAEEWVRQTFTNDSGVVAPVTEMMLGSRQAAVDYMTPLGLHHLMARGHHYGPGPWVAGGPRADWTSLYYHRADAAGIGFDRTATGSNAVSPVLPSGRASDSGAWRRSETTTCSGSTTCRGTTGWPPAGRSGTSCCTATRPASTPCGGCRPPGARSRGASTRSATRRCAAFLSDPGAGGALVARRERPLLPDLLEAADTRQEYEKPEHDLDYYMKVDKRYVPGI